MATNTMYFTMDNSLNDVSNMQTNSSQYGHCQYQIDDSAMTNLERNVFYSNDYSAHSSMMDLFKNAYKPKKSPSKRNENLPDSFYDQFASTRSSSASHSRESSMDAIYNSPQRSMQSTDSFNVANQPLTVNCLPPSMCKSRVRLQHPSNGTSKQINYNLVPYHVKTSSLPASFAPSNETDSNNNNIEHDHCSNTSTQMNTDSNYNNNKSSQIRLESFNQLQQNLMYHHNKNKANESRVSGIGNKKKPKSEEIGIVQLVMPAYTSTDRMIGLNTASISATTSNDIHQQQVNAWARQNYPSHTAGSMTQNKEQITLHNIQQLQSERNGMLKRQLELEQWHINRISQQQSADIHRQFRSLGSLNNLDSIDQNAAVSSHDIVNPRYRNPLQHNYHNQFLPGHQASSPQESFDSGLDIGCYSSSFESSNCVTPETYLQATGINVSNPVGISGNHSSATLNKMVTSVTDASNQLSFANNGSATLPVGKQQTSTAKKADTSNQQQPTNGTVADNQDSFARINPSRIQKGNNQMSLPASNTIAATAITSSVISRTSAPTVSAIIMSSPSSILSTTPIVSFNADGAVPHSRQSSPSSASPTSPFSVNSGPAATLIDNVYNSMSLGSSPVSMVDDNNNNSNNHPHINDGSLMLSSTVDDIISNPIMTPFYEEPFLSTCFNNDYENIFDFGNVNFCTNSNNINNSHSPSHNQPSFLVGTMSSANGNDRLSTVIGNDGFQFC